MILTVKFSTDFREKAYDYLWDGSEALSPGDFVLVPVRGDGPWNLRPAVVVRVDANASPNPRIQYRHALQRITTERLASPEKS